MAKQAKYRVDLPDGSSHLCATFAEAQAVERQHARQNPDWAAIRAKAAEGARATGKALAKAGRKTAAGIKAAAPGVGQALKHGFKAAKEQNPRKRRNPGPEEHAKRGAKHLETAEDLFFSGTARGPHSRADMLAALARAAMAKQDFMDSGDKSKVMQANSIIKSASEELQLAPARNPSPEEHKRRAGQRYTAAVRSGDPLDAARLAFQAESDFDDAGDRRGAEDAHAYALGQLKASRRNPAQWMVDREELHAAVEAHLRGQHRLTEGDQVSGAKVIAVDAASITFKTRDGYLQTYFFSNYDVRNPAGPRKRNNPPKPLVRRKPGRNPGTAGCCAQNPKRGK